MMWKKGRNKSPVAFVVVWWQLAYLMWTGRAVFTFCFKTSGKPFKSNSLLTGPWLPCFTIQYPVQKQNKQTDCQT